MSAEKKSFDSPDEKRAIGNGQADVVNFDTASAARATMQPGWRWSTDVKPIVGTESCQADHLGYVVSGRLHVVTDDGGEAEVGPGDAYVVHPGHDAWVVGDEPFVGLEFQSKTAETYAKT
ncbi:MAG: cupin domain-containing protein [Actinomycetota bacterium]